MYNLLVCMKFWPIFYSGSTKHRNPSRMPPVQSILKNTSTVKPVYNGHPRDPKIIVVVVDRWSLFRGNFML